MPLPRNSRRAFLRTALAAGAAGLGGCRAPAPPAAPPSRGQPLRQALERAAAYLLGRQAADGAWRSDVYGNFRTGDALTPLVLEALFAAGAVPGRHDACARGTAYLATLAPPGRAIDPGALTYPVYTCALAVTVLSRATTTRHRPARDAWLAALGRQQLTEALGWQPADLPYGGWGFAPEPVLAPGPAQANLSATAFALDALRAAGRRDSDPVLRKALAFVYRCQNHPGGAADGGFFFSPDDVVRNKGGATRDAVGREHYHSYGSATADGLCCLRACGLPPQHARVTAARDWLERHFHPATHPGTYAAERAGARDGVYYYYARSVARAFRAAGVRTAGPADGRVRWAEALADELRHRQRADGSWVNAVVAQREDDPLVATPFAVAALAACLASVEED